MLMKSKGVVASLVQTHLAHDATLLELVPDYVRWKDRDGSLVGHRATVQFGSEVVQTYVTARTAAPMRLASEAERLRQPFQDAPVPEESR